MLSVLIDPYHPDLDPDLREHLLKMQREHGDNAGEVLLEQVKLGIERVAEEKNDSTHE